MDIAKVIAETLVEETQGDSPARYLWCLLQDDLPGAADELGRLLANPARKDDADLQGALTRLRAAIATPRDHAGGAADDAAGVSDTPSDGPSDGPPDTPSDGPASVDSEPEVTTRLAAPIGVSSSRKHVVDGQVFITGVASRIDQLALAVQAIERRQPPPSPEQVEFLAGAQLREAYTAANSADPFVAAAFFCPVLAGQVARLRRALDALPGYLKKRSKKFGVPPARLAAPRSRSERDALKDLLGSARLARDAVHQQDLLILQAGVEEELTASPPGREVMAATQSEIKESFQELKGRRRHLLRLLEAITAAGKTLANAGGSTSGATAPSLSAQLTRLRELVPWLESACDTAATLAQYLAEISEGFEQLLDPAYGPTCILRLIKLVRHLVCLELHAPALRRELFKYPMLTTKKELRKDVLAALEHLV